MLAAAVIFHTSTILRHLSYMRVASTWFCSRQFLKPPLLQPAAVLPSKKIPPLKKKISCFIVTGQNNWNQKIGHRKDISIQTLSLARSSAKTEGNNLSSVQRTLSGSESFSYSGIPTMSKGNRPGNRGNIENSFDPECNHPPFRPLSSSLRAAECSPLRLSSVLKRGAAANRVTPHLKRI